METYIEGILKSVIYEHVRILVVLKRNWVSSDCWEPVKIRLGSVANPEDSPK